MATAEQIERIAALLRQAHPAASLKKVNEAAGWESAACTANTLVPFFSNIKQHILYLFPWQPGKTGNTLL